uniref:Uncharacterized protein n=1 Tax=Parascaris equorum TaxID=6256 RepID=A0A914S2Z9_PAREQ
LSEFEKNSSKRAFEATNLSSSKLRKLSVRNADDTTADLEESSDKLSAKKTAISKDGQGQWIINGKIWPKDSLHHIPKWLEDEYKGWESKGETESLEEEDGTRTTTLAVEDDSEEENLRDSEMRTTKISAGTDVLNAGNNKESADEEPDISGEKELSSKEPRKLVVSETDDEIGEDERSGQPETSDEQGNIITGDSESNGTSEDYDMKELTLNEPNEDYGSGEEERA